MTAELAHKAYGKNTRINIKMINTIIEELSQHDLNDVLALIAQHDEDDAQDARDSLENENSIHFVAKVGNEIVGISGYERVMGTDHTSYLSWTYVNKNQLRQGIGGQLLSYTLDYAKNENCRLMLVRMSDYAEPGTNMSIYAAARSMYIKFGFTSQIVTNNFYDEDENSEILALRLAPQADNKPVFKDEKPRLEFCGLQEITETEGAFTFEWTVPSGFSLFKPRNFSAKDVKIGLEAAHNQGARMVLLSFPSNLPLIHAPLQQAGFKYLGDIQDYYEDGLNEMHFIYQF